MTRTELENFAENVVTGACGTVGGIVSAADFVKDYGISNLLQLDRLGIEAFGVVAGVILIGLGALRVKRDEKEHEGWRFPRPHKPQTNP